MTDDEQQRKEEAALEKLAADGLASLEEAETFIDCSRSTLRDLMDTGALVYVVPKGMKDRKIPRAALKAYVVESLKETQAAKVKKAEAKAVAAALAGNTKGGGK